MKKFATTTILTLSVTVGLDAQQFSVVPASRASSNAPAYGWIAGASRDVRQQTLIGASHLTALLGKSITAIQLRRHSANEQYNGGSCNLTVRLSHSPLSPVECSPTFADNTGPQGAPAFAGTITFPTSPAPVGGTVGWTTNETVRIQLTNPFIYNGGTLCIDVVGTPIAGQEANWWMANLELEDIAGSTLDLGGGCGLYGGASSEWSRVSRRSLLPGSHARFSALGTPGGLGLAAFGTSASIGLPLSVTGLPSAPGCDLWLSSINAILPTIFTLPANPADVSFGGEAEVSFQIPNTPTVFGFTMTTQWVDWTQMATSNAIEWSVANGAPTLEMALIEGAASDTKGLALPYMGHVFRFEYQ